MVETTTKEIERANAYKQMFEMWSWKDFENFLEEERQNALQMAVVSDDLKDVQIQRGRIKELDSIKSHLSYILEAQ